MHAYAPALCCCCCRCFCCTSRMHQLGRQAHSAVEHKAGHFPSRFHTMYSWQLMHRPAATCNWVICHPLRAVPAQQGSCCQRSLPNCFAATISKAYLECSNNIKLIEQESQPKEGAKPIAFTKQYTRSGWGQVIPVTTRPRWSDIMQCRLQTAWWFQSVSSLACSSTCPWLTSPPAQLTGRGGLTLQHMAMTSAVPSARSAAPYAPCLRLAGAQAFLHVPIPPCAAVRGAQQAQLQAVLAQCVRPPS